MNFVCEWQLSTFETQDGEDFNTSEPYEFTFHATLEDAIEYSQSRIAERYEAIFCNTILEYQDDFLVCKHCHTDVDYWRVYPMMEHWNEMWPHLMTYPPFVHDDPEKRAYST